jgi:ureidoglycolate lyase
VIEAAPLDAASFAGLGTVVERPGAPPDAEGHGLAWWAEAALLDDEAPYALGFLDLQPARMRLDWAERHARSREAVVALSGPCLVYAAPADSRPPDGLRAFRLEPGQAVVLERGVWHGAPLALDGSGTALVVLRRGTGDDDVELVHFEPIEVSPCP